MQNVPFAVRKRRVRGRDEYLQVVQNRIQPGRERMRGLVSGRYVAAGCPVCLRRVVRE